MRLSWEAYAVGIARAASRRSEDPRTKVGAALLRHDRTLAAVGYNGAPPDVDLDPALPIWRTLAIHAEANALRYARPHEVWLLASTRMPCLQCILLASAYGASRIAYAEEFDPYQHDRQAVLDLADRCQIVVVKVEERE